MAASKPRSAAAAAVAAQEPPPPPLLPHRGPVLVDSGPLLALMNRRDAWHARTRDWLAANREAQLISTWPVLNEVTALLSRRIASAAAIDFLRWVQRGAVVVDTPQAVSLAEVLAISERFADLPFDLADASIAEAAARLKIRHLLSVDSDFDVYRDRSARALINLLTA
ncbi:VapC toxin family PIN domain ribonuclease [Rubrivivax gelatinosus]|uniref:Ribonuclease VapC n=1 Tax=Rubrivivax gelatinosus TaxID=28068 RepID=A0ABS1DQT4_RUBGE|nr:VapC toxin family PIN domain ribonuclease [Rubrivivax gelatinosus]MBK1712359.1 VapC toxin family PIN domain ribonuclease [Rubrivivax gelatinosus]